MIVKLCGADDLPRAGELKSFRGANNLDICITQTEDGASGLVAFDNSCPHQGAPLSAGHMEGCRIVCPYHAWSWDVTTGKSSNAADPDLLRYEVRRYGAEVFIQLPEHR